MNLQAYLVAYSAFLAILLESSVCFGKKNMKASTSRSDKLQASKQSCCLPVGLLSVEVERLVNVVAALKDMLLVNQLCHESDGSICVRALASVSGRGTASVTTGCGLLDFLPPVVSPSGRIM